jgi:hypothetical protein
MQAIHRIVNIESTALSCCVSPVNIPRGGDSRLFAKISFEGFFLERCRKYFFNTLEVVQRFRFKNKTRNSSEIKRIRSGSTVTIVLVHSNMVIFAGTDGYQIR